MQSVWQADIECNKSFIWPHDGSLHDIDNVKILLSYTSVFQIFFTWSSQNFWISMTRPIAIGGDGPGYKNMLCGLVQQQIKIILPSPPENVTRLRPCVRCLDTAPVTK